MWSMDQETVVAKSITSGNATGISHGSFKQYRDIAACILEDDNNIQSGIYAIHNIPGNKLDQSLYRSELEGISMMMVLIQCIITCHRIR